MLFHQPRSAAGYIGIDALADLVEGVGLLTTPRDDGIPDLPPGSINVGHLHDVEGPWVIWNTDGDEVTWTVVSQLGTSGGVEENPTFNRFSTPFSTPLKTVSVQLQYFNEESGLQTGYAEIDIGTDGTVTITDRVEVGLPGGEPVPLDEVDLATDSELSDALPSYHPIVADGRVTHVQDIRFCRSADGVGHRVRRPRVRPTAADRLVLAEPPAVRLAEPVWRHFLVELGKIATVIRFDERGHGLSDRDVTDHSLEMRVADLEAVADHAGLDRFAMFAMAQGGPISVEYATRHPERLSRLIIYGSYAGAMQNATPEEIELDEAFQALIKVGWERPTPEFRRVFTSLMIPDATEEQMQLARRAAADGDHGGHGDAGPGAAQARRRTPPAAAARPARRW